MAAAEAAAQPATPTGLTAVMVNDGRIDISWTDNSAGELGFNIYSATNAAFTINTMSLSVGAGITSYSDNTVWPGNDFYYKVTAFDATGESAPSNVVMVSIPLPTAPNAPSNLAATVSAGNVDLTWTDNSGNEDNFLIERAEDPGFSMGYVTFMAAKNAVSYIDTTAVRGMTYYYQVIAYNTLGYSPASNKASVSLPMPADTTNPVITITGTNPLDVMLNSAYADAGATATDNIDGDITASIITTNNVNTAVAGTYTVTYMVTDSSGNTATDARTVNVLPNSIPIVTTPSTQTVQMGNLLIFTVSATDPDGDTLTYSLANAPAGATIDPASGVFSWTANAGSAVYVEVLVSDGINAPVSAFITITITAVGSPDITAPVITLLGINPENIAAGSVYTDAGATALDNVDGDVTASIVVTNNVNTAVLGTYLVDYTVTDAVGNAATATRAVNVVPDIVPPVITPLGINPVDIFVGSVYADAGATATDNVNGDITASIITTGTVNTAIAGAYAITYSVSDAAGNTASATRTVNVVLDPVLPVITIIGNNPEALQLKSAYADAGATATDNINGDITASIITTNTVNTDVPGTYSVTYSVTDSSGNTATAERLVDILPDTGLPVITILGNNPETIVETRPYTDAGATATDNINGDITASIITTNTVNTAIAGAYAITYSVSDAAGNTASATRTVNVVANSPPILDPIPVQEALPGAIVTFTAAATDADGDALEYSLANAPAGATINTATGLFTWTSAAGTHNFDVQVTDGIATVATQVTAKINTPPSIAAIAEQIATPGSLLAFTIPATDADGDALKYSLANAPAGATADATGVLRWTPLISGTYTFGAHASDGVANTTALVTVIVPRPAVKLLTASDTKISRSDSGSTFIEAVNYSGEMNTLTAPALLFSPDASGVLSGCSGNWTTTDAYEYRCIITNVKAELPSLSVKISGAEDIYGNVQDNYTSASHMEVYMMEPRTSDDYAEKNGIWQKDSQTITLLPDCGIAGCNWTRYCTADLCKPANGIDYAAPITTSAQGINYFRYASMDNAGNIQPTIERLTKIDNTSYSNSSVAFDATTPTTIDYNSEVQLEINTTSNLTAALSIKKQDSAPNTSAIGIPALGKYYEITSPALEDVNKSILIKVYYTDSEVAAAGISEGTLRLYYYNQSSGTWVKHDAPNGGVDTTNNYVWAITNHFSTWGAFGSSPPAPAPSSNNDGGGGGGGGGGSLPTSKKNSAIEGTPEATAAKQPIAPAPTTETAAQQTGTAVKVPPGALNPITGAAVADTSRGANPKVGAIIIGAVVFGGLGAALVAKRLKNRGWRK